MIKLQTIKKKMNKKLKIEKKIIEKKQKENELPILTHFSKLNKAHHTSPF